MYRDVVAVEYFTMAIHRSASTYTIVEYDNLIQPSTTDPGSECAAHSKIRRETWLFAWHGSRIEILRNLEAIRRPSGRRYSTVIISSTRDNGPDVQRNIHSTSRYYEKCYPDTLMDVKLTSPSGYGGSRFKYSNLQVKGQFRFEALNIFCLISTFKF